MISDVHQLICRSEAFSCVLIQCHNFPSKFIPRVRRCNAQRNCKKYPRATFQTLRASLSMLNGKGHDSTIRKKLNHCLFERLARRNPLLPKKKNMAAQLRFANLHLNKPHRKATFSSSPTHKDITLHTYLPQMPFLKQTPEYLCLLLGSNQARFLVAHYLSTTTLQSHLNKHQDFWNNVL